MKYQNRTRRCFHGFAVGIVRCPACLPRHEDKDLFVSIRAPRTFRIVPGTKIVGIEVIRRIGNDRVEAKCGCGSVYQPSRSMLRKHKQMGTAASCPKCTGGRHRQQEARSA